MSDIRIKAVPLTSLQYMLMFLAPANLEATVIVFLATSPVFGFLMLIVFLEDSFLNAIVTYPLESVLYCKQIFGFGLSDIHLRVLVN